MSSKVKMSFSLSSPLAEALAQLAQQWGSSKSAVVELALKDFTKQRFKEEAKQLAKMSFEDLPSEDDWLGLYPDVQ